MYMGSLGNSSLISILPDQKRKSLPSSLDFHALMKAVSWSYVSTIRKSAIITLTYEGHKDLETSYAWGSSEQLQWAAFYSDCEHEVLEVTDGWRVTLTYNLHLTPMMQVSPAVLDIKSLDLYAHVMAALEDPAALPTGCVIGFHCQHDYPRSHKYSLATIESCLKGIDRALFLVLRNLGFEVAVRPVLCRNEIEERMGEYYDDPEDLDEKSDSDSDDASRNEETSKDIKPSKALWDPAFDRMLDEAKQDDRLPRLSYESEPEERKLDGQTGLTFQKRLEHILTQRRIKGLPEWKPPRVGIDRVGHTFRVDLPRHVNMEADDVGCIHVLSIRY
jgi:hypothetical protein